MVDSSDRLSRLFAAIDATLSLLLPRNVLCTFERVQSSVATFLNGETDLTLEELRTIVAIAPKLLNLRMMKHTVDNFTPSPAAHSEYHIVVNLPKAYRAATMLKPNVLQRRRNSFQELLNSAIVSSGGLHSLPMCSLPQLPESKVESLTTQISLKRPRDMSFNDHDDLDNDDDAELDELMLSLPMNNDSSSIARLELPQDHETVCRGLFGILTSQPSYRCQLLYCRDQAVRLAQYHVSSEPGRIHERLHPFVEGALRGVGISQLFLHQSQAIEAALDGRHVVVSTSTASGKSMCYLLPIFHALCVDSTSCALLLFPTKALAQDQYRAIMEIIRGTALESIVVPRNVDGDTASDLRLDANRDANIILSNPDTLHATLLPNHRSWNRFFNTLKYVVVDEMHMYTGAFGCHVGFVLQRLDRLATSYGTTTGFICCSATIANPRELAVNLLPPRCTSSEETLVLVNGETAPRARKLIGVWQPPRKTRIVLKARPEHPYLDKGQSHRRSAVVEAAEIICHCMKLGLRTLVFCRYRKACEAAILTLREVLAEQKLENLLPAVSSYRGGYGKEDRRDIERRLFNGELLAVVATNALELGIDVGSLDVTVHLGVPSTMSSLWQQIGRAGRTERASAAILVLENTAIDAYFGVNPEKSLDQAIEHARINLDNEHILQPHLLCAIVEHPFPLDDIVKFGAKADTIQKCIQRLADGLNSNGSRIFGGPAIRWLEREQHWATSFLVDRPALKVSLREIGDEQFKVYDDKMKLLDELESERAFMEIYPGAVYNNRGQQYIIENLDVMKRVALARPAVVSYSTKQQDVTDLEMGRVNAMNHLGSFLISHANGVAETRVYGFHKMWKFSREIFETVPLYLPPIRADTTIVWIDLDSLLVHSMETKMFDVKGSIHAACHAIRSMLCLLCVCTVANLAMEHVSALEGPKRIRSRIAFYDRTLGSSGLMLLVLRHLPEAIKEAQHLVEQCECSNGCMECVLDIACSEHNHVIDKLGARFLLKTLTTQ